MASRSRSGTIPGGGSNGERALIDTWNHTGTVLLVDDDRAVRKLATRIIATAGLDVISADDGVEAVEQLERHGAEICCVLLDLTMPRMGGEEAFRELRRLRRDVPVILSSGYDEEVIRDRFAGEELSGFVKKPYVADELIGTLRDVLER